MLNVWALLNDPHGFWLFSRVWLIRLAVAYFDLTELCLRLDYGITYVLYKYLCIISVTYMQEWAKNEVLGHFPEFGWLDWHDIA